MLDDTRLGDLAVAIRRLWSSIVHELDHAPELEGMPTHLYFILGAVASQPRRMSELAERSLTSCANVTAIVDRLAERGLVERVRSEEDRRVIEVVATPTGREALDSAKHAFAVRVAEVLSGLDDAEKDQLLGLLHKALHD